MQAACDARDLEQIDVLLDKAEAMGMSDYGDRDPRDDPHAPYIANIHNGSHSTTMLGNSDYDEIKAAAVLKVSLEEEKASITTVIRCDQHAP